MKMTLNSYSQRTEKQDQKSVDFARITISLINIDSMKTLIIRPVTAAIQSLITTGVICALLGLSFFVAEPRVGRAQDTSGPFTINQVITGETSFLVDAASTTLSGNLNGITGGTANGSTTVVVQTNSSGGYTMDIAFYDNGSDHAMEGRTTGTNTIHDYLVTGGVPTYTFSTASTSAVFGYTVTAANTSDLDQSFLNNGSNACNTGSARSSYDQCWMEPTVAAFQVINRTSSAVNGATTTLHFRVHVPNNPTPGIVADTYTATATLTVAPQ